MILRWLALSLLAAPIAAQNVWHVNASARRGGDGRSWATAMNTLQSALDVATRADQIWLAAGTYHPTALGNPSSPRSARFLIEDAFQIFGGFDGTETSVAERDPSLFDDTILSGDLGVPGDPSDNAFHVLFLTGLDGPLQFVRLDGLVITGGNSPDEGGGILMRFNRGALTPLIRLRNCILFDNRAARGGAIAVLDNGVVRLERCTLESNIATGRGGAIYSNGNVFAVSTRFSSNRAGQGGAEYFRASGPTPPLHANCVYTNNKARLGGAVYLNAETLMAAVCYWYNCTFYRNNAIETGGAIHANTTNVPPAELYVFNSILWDNHAAASPAIFGSGVVRFSDVQGGFIGNGVIDVDPVFISGVRPSGGSPVNDAGNNNLVPNDFLDLDHDGDRNERLPVDLLGATRRVDDPTAPDVGAGTAPIVDMGAYEFDPVR